MLKTKSVTVQSVTMLTVHVSVKGRDILPDVFRNEDIAKGVLIGVTHIENNILDNLFIRDIS